VSDATTDNGLHGERRRALASFAAAFVLHAALLAALALGLGVGAGAAVTPPMTIDLQTSSEPGMDALAASAGPEGVPSAPAMSSAPAAPAVGKGSDSSGFVIPAPRAQPADATAPSASGPSFREAGGSAGVAQSIPSVPSQVPAPTFSAVQQGSGTGTASSSGAGASSVQRSGTGVLVTGSSGSASGGSLDLSQLDNALAGGGAARSGRAAGSGAGARGSGTASSTTQNGGGGNGGQSYSVLWGGSGSGRGRTLLFTSSPKLPSWVSAQGLTLSVTVSFTLLSDGVIGGASLQQSSGYADVDAAVIDAIRRWRFTPAEGAPPARGLIPYVIRTQ
jgi:TonB family protein